MENSDLYRICNLRKYSVVPGSASENKVVLLCVWHLRCVECNFCSSVSWKCVGKGKVFMLTLLDFE